MISDIFGIKLLIIAGSSLSLLPFCYFFLSKKRRDFCSPIILFPLAYFMFSFARPLSIYFLDDPRTSLFALENMFYSLVLLNIGIIGFYAGYFGLTNLPLYKRVVKLKSLGKIENMGNSVSFCSCLYRGSILFVACSIFFICLSVYYGGSWAVILNSPKEAAQATSGLRYYSYLIGILIAPVSFGMLLVSVTTVKRNIKFIFGLLIALFLTLMFLLNTRNGMFQVIIVIAIVYNYLVGFIKRKYIICFGIAWVAISLVIIITRISGSISVEPRYVIANLTELVANPKEALRFTLNTSDSSFIVTNVFNYVKEFKFGATYGESILSLFVPSFLFGRPFVDPTAWFKMNFAPHATGGFGFSVIAESYMNFSFIGPFIILFIVGSFLNIMYRLNKHFSTTCKNNLFVLLYAVTMWDSLWFIRESSHAFFKGLLFHTLVFFMIFSLTRFFKEVICSFKCNRAVGIHSKPDFEINAYSKR